MTTSSLNGNAVGITRRDGTPEGHHIGATGPSQLNDHAAVENSKDTHRQRLEAARREIDALATLNRRLREESALLTESLANARRFAFHDELTGLPNRRLLHDHFIEAVARARRQHNQVVLLFVDLDDFKSINDALGHVCADRLLQQVASRLKACVRRSDTACRYGGDELVILLPDIETPGQAIAAIEKIRMEITAPYDIDGMPVSIAASIGMATWPIDGKDCLALVKAADVAMYRQKKTSWSRTGRSRTNGGAPHRGSEEKPTHKHMTIAKGDSTLTTRE